MDFIILPKFLQPRVCSIDEIASKILPPGIYIVVPIIQDGLFQHTTLQHPFDIVFSMFNVCAVLVYYFRFLVWIFNHRMSSLNVFILFEVVNQRENYIE